jgi:hypothetical protein
MPGKHTLHGDCRCSSHESFHGHQARYAGSVTVSEEVPKENARGAAVISTGGWAVYDVADAPHFVGILLRGGHVIWLWREFRDGYGG